jgi:hypothetical protein
MWVVDGSYGCDVVDKSVFGRRRISVLETESRGKVRLLRAQAISYGGRCTADSLASLFTLCSMSERKERRSHRHLIVVSIIVTTMINQKQYLHQRRVSRPPRSECSLCNRFE